MHKSHRRGASHAIDATSARRRGGAALTHPTHGFLCAQVPKDYAFAFAACGLFSTFLGQSAVDWVVRKYKKDAIVILVIASIMLIALVLMTYDGIMQVVHATTYGFSPLC